MRRIKHCIGEVSLEFDRTATMFGHLPARRQHRAELIKRINPLAVLITSAFLELDEIRPVFRDIEGSPAILAERIPWHAEGTKCAFGRRMAEANGAEQNRHALDGVSDLKTAARRLGVLPKPRRAIANAIGLRFDRDNAADKRIFASEPATSENMLQVYEQIAGDAL